jgi:hypothetical protein
MLARRSFLALLVIGSLTSQAQAQVRHYPGPSSRYEWNPSPYTGQFNSGSYNGSGRWNSGHYHGGGYGYGNGFGYGYGYPYYPVITPPIFVPFGATYGTYGDGWYGPQWPPSYTNYGYSPVNPFFIPGGTLNGRWPNEPNPLNDPLLDRAVPQVRRRGALPREDRLPVIKPSTPEAQQRSLRQLATGDQQFKAGRYMAAAQEYRRAIAVAEDLPDNYFRLALALTELRRYDDAIDQIKYGMLLDPTWPQRGQALIDYFEVGANFEKTAMVRRVGDWVRGDLRNPDRIFLLAVLLHFDGDRENAKKLIESAMRVAGDESYLTAFLAKDEPPPADQEQPAEGAVPEPPAAGVDARKAAPAKPAAPVEQAVPQRNSDPPEEAFTPPEKFPELKAPELPGSSEPAKSEESKLVPGELTGPSLTGQ